MTGQRTYTAELSAEDDAAMLLLWSLKLDTFDIATRLRRPEWQIANRLRALRDLERTRLRLPGFSSKGKGTGMSIIKCGTDDYMGAKERDRAASNALLKLLIEHHSEPVQPEPVVEVAPDPLPDLKAFQKWLDSFEPLPAPTYPTVHKIKRCVSEHFGITIPEIDSDRRMARVVKPRQIAMYITRKLTPRSLPDIGRKFGGKDHATVIHALRKIGQLVESDDGFANEISSLMAKVQT